MTELEKARNALMKFSADRSSAWPNHVKYLELVEAFVNALVEEKLSAYQRKSFRFD